MIYPRRAPMYWVAVAALMSVVGCRAATASENEMTQRACREASTVTPSISSTTPTAERQTERVVLITLDGVRWQEVFGGVDPVLADAARLSAQRCLSARSLMPNLYDRVLPRGVAIGAPCHGATISASGPNHVSLPGYIELLTGRRTTCTTNECPQITEPTLLDELADRGDDIAVFGSWEHLDHAIARDPSRFLWTIAREKGAHRDELRSTEEMALLLEEGDDADPSPGHGQYRPDQQTVPLAIAYLKAHRPRFFYLALGDSDEVAHAGDYEGYLASIRHADRTIGEVLDLLEADDALHSTTVMITVDHGRANDFESHGGNHPEAARVWLFAVGASIAPRGFVDAPKPRYLRDVAPTLRVLMGLPSQGGPTSGEVLTELL